MKRILIGLLIVAMAIGLTSCSQDVYSKLGGLMGKMGNNVYGIEPNMADVEKAMSAVDNSLQKDGDGVVTGVDLAEAVKITESIGDVKASEQKTEALKEELAKPVLPETATDEEIKAVRDSLTNAVDGASSDLDAALAGVDLSAEQQKIVDDVKAALSAISSSIENAETITKADVTTAAVIASVSQAISDFATADAETLQAQAVELAEKALSSLDALKMSTEVAGIDVLGGLDLNSLIGSAFGDSPKGFSEEDLDKVRPFAPMMGNLIAAVSRDGAFDEGRFNELVAQSKAVKAVYDALSMPYNGKTVSEILGSDISHGMTADDVVMYMVVTAFGEDCFSDYLKAVISANHDILSKLENPPADSEFNPCETELDAAKAKLSGYIGSEDFKALFDIMDGKTAPPEAGKTFFRTLAVLVRDAELTGTLEFVKGQLAKAND